MIFHTYISPAELHQIYQKPDIVVVDTRFWLDEIEKGKRDYIESHIPGAIYAHLDDDLSGTVRSGVTGRHPLPDPGEFAKLVSKWGISNTTQVIVYDDRGGAIAGRLWWMMRWIGNKRVAVLNGGFPAWLKAGYPVSKEIPSPAEKVFKARVDESSLASIDDVMEAIKSKRNLLVDSRDFDRYIGKNEPIDPIAGHIPNAISAPFASILSSSGEIIENDKLRFHFSEVFNKYDAADVIFYCGSGVTSIINSIACKHVGLGEARIYIGSWSEWITDSGRYIATDDRYVS